MADSEDDFRIRLGRIGNRRGRKAIGYAKRVRTVAERFTRLDRGILRDASDGTLSLAAKPERDPRRHVLRMGRLRVLERMGLADETAAGIWRIAPDLEPTLRRMGSAATSSRPCTAS